MALFGFLQEQKYLSIREKLTAPQLTAPPNFIYQTLFPLLGSGLSFLEEQTIELLNKHLPDASFADASFDEFATIFPPYLTGLTTKKNSAPIQQFLRKRIAWNIQNGWFASAQLAKIKNLFHIDDPVYCNELAMLARELLNTLPVDSMVLDFFRDIITNFDLQFFDRLIKIFLYVNHPAIQELILDLRPVPAIYEDHLISYLRDQRELTTSAQERLFSFLLHGSDNQKVLALAIFANNKIVFEDLVNEIKRAGYLQSSSKLLQASAAVIIASSSQITFHKTSNCVQDISRLQFKVTD